eukprot:s47_g77.t1
MLYLIRCESLLSFGCKLAIACSIVADGVLCRSFIGQLIQCSIKAFRSVTSSPEVDQTCCNMSGRAFMKCSTTFFRPFQLCKVLALLHAASMKRLASRCATLRHVNRQVRDGRLAFRQHCRTSTASSRLQWALPDFNRDCQIAVGTAGLHPRAPDCSGHCRTSIATARSQWALPDFIRELQIPAAYGSNPKTSP